MWITRVSIDNPVFATMMMVALVVLGFASYQQLSKEEMPDVSFPMVFINTIYPDAAPGVVEQEVTRRIEQAVNTVNGVKNIMSTSQEGQSNVMVEFELSVEAAAAAQDVREQVSVASASFREEVRDSVVLRLDPGSQPVLSLAITAKDLSLRDLTTLTEEVIVRRLQNVPGVGSVNMAGGRSREIEIRLDADKLQAAKTSVSEVIDTLVRENALVPTGNLRNANSETAVQVKGLIVRPEQFANLIVSRRGGEPVYLDQVAEVIDGQQEQMSLALINGKPGLAVDIIRTQNSNTIDVVDEAQKTIEKLRQELPHGVDLAVIRDGSEVVRSSISGVQETLIEGALLTILIVSLFLHSWRSTVITGVTLPIAVIGSFTAIAALGFSINIMTLTGLSLSIGILIDDAIVVRENIVRHLAMGKSHRQAALDGTNEIGLAVLATTFTIIAVFLPVAFMGGMIGKFFFQFGITISAAVIISLLVSFTLDPMLSSVWYDPAAHGKRPRGLAGKIIAAHDRVFNATRDGYGRLLEWSLQHRGKTVFGALSLLLASFMLLPYIGSEFIPAGNRGEIALNIEAPPDSSLEYVQLKLQQVDAVVRELPGIKSTYATVNAGFASGKTKAQIFARLTPAESRTHGAEEIMQMARDRMKEFPTLETRVFDGDPFRQAPVEISLQGPDIDTLKELSRQVEELALSVTGVTDLQNSMKTDRPTVLIDVNREKASDLGVGIHEVGETLRTMLAGTIAGGWIAPNGESYDIVVRMPDLDRKNVADLEKVYVASRFTDEDGTPRMVPLTAIAQTEMGDGPVQIKRRNLNREAHITGSVMGRPVMDAVKEVQAKTNALTLPPGYRIVYTGEAEFFAEAMYYAAVAMALSVIFIYLILASQFNSFLQPVAIMMALPLAFVGVFGLLFLIGGSISLFTMIGIITLMGLVTKNAILLIDFINQARKGGATRHDAIIQAGRIRFRPIIMTSLAMIFGMLPLALSGEQVGMPRAPMAHAVIGGLITSTLLTLVVVPVIYTYLDSLAEWMMRLISPKHVTPDELATEVEAG